MLLSIRDILNLPVETQSGQHLGKVEGVVVETETQRLYQYQVRRGSISRLFGKAELLIHRDQVISITRSRVVVEDGAYREAERAGAVIKKQTPALDRGVVTHE